MEPSPANKQKIDLLKLTPEDSDAMRKLMGNMEKHLKVKNQTLGELQMELRDVKEVVKRDPSLLIFVQRICVKFPLDQIKEKFAVFGRILDAEENPQPGFDRSVYKTYFTRDAILKALNSIEPILINGEVVKINKNKFILIK
jgi:hypothetical protein